MIGVDRPLRVLALTRTVCEHTLTWRLRVEVLLPWLQDRRIEVDAGRLPRRSADLPEFCRERQGYDLLWLHRVTFWPSELRLLKTLAPRMVLDIDDPVGLSSSRPFNFALNRYLKFRATARAADAVLGASEGLCELARPYCENVHHVPLCCEPDAYSLRAAARRNGEPLRLVWLGSRSTFKYLDALRPRLEEVGRQVGNVALTVVGHSSLSLRHLPVTNLPWSPANDQDTLRSGHVGLAPVRADRWTRAKASLKPLQYLASGMPFVGNPVGVNVPFAGSGSRGLLADTTAEWVDAIARLERDEDARFAMGERGIEYVLEQHAAAPLAGQVADVFDSLCGRAQPRSTPTTRDLPTALHA